MPGLMSMGLVQVSDTTAKIFYLTSQKQGIKGSGNFMEEISSLHVPAQPKFTFKNILLMDI